MRTLLFTILLSSFAVPALALDKCYSGSWYEPETSGEGIDLQISEGKVVLYRYAHLNGSPNYWTSSLNNSDSAVLNFTAYQTMRTATGIEVFDVGSITLTTNPPENSRMIMEWDYDIDLDKIGSGTPWCLSGGCSGSKELSHLFQPVTCK